MQWEKKFLYNKECEDHYRLTCPRCGYEIELIMDGEYLKDQNYCPCCGEYLRETEDGTVKRIQRMERNARRKSEEIKRQGKWIEHLEKMLANEREKIAGCEQMAKIYTAYIYLLLKKLEAVEDNKVTFKEDEIQEAIRKGETRAIRSEEGWSLYYKE